MTHPEFNDDDFNRAGELPTVSVNLHLTDWTKLEAVGTVTLRGILEAESGGMQQAVDVTIFVASSPAP